MKKQILLLPILLAIFIISCSSDDSQPNEEEQTKTDLKLYKKTYCFNDGILTSSQEIFYDNDNKIESVNSNEVDYLIRTFTVSYDESSSTSNYSLHEYIAE